VPGNIRGQHTDIDGTVTDTPATTQSSFAPLPFEVGGVLFYVVVGAGSILAVFITCIVVFSLCIGCICLQRNRAST
jgi:hypothetical protein